MSAVQRWEQVGRLSGHDRMVKYDTGPYVLHDDHERVVAELVAAHEKALAEARDALTAAGHEPIRYGDKFGIKPNGDAYWDLIVCRYCADLNHSQEGLDQQEDEIAWPCTTVAAIDTLKGASDG